MGQLESTRAFARAIVRRTAELTGRPKELTLKDQTTRPKRVTVESPSDRRSGSILCSTVSVLCANRNSIYHDMEGVEVFDVDRDARTFRGDTPIIGHPPCRTWSAFAFLWLSVMVQCPRCKKDVSQLWGNGDYPNSSWRCQRCDDAETTCIVGCFLVVLVVIFLASIVVASLIG